MNQPIVAIPSDVREKIFQVSDDLYAQSNKQSFPTVYNVRRIARVDMNAASAVMRDWRRAQTAQASPVAVQVPDAVVQANNQVMVTLWTQAQELANESLRSAQSAWDAERTELDEMRQELAQAYEAQADEYDKLKYQADAAEQAHQEAAKQVANELYAIRAELSQALTRAERAEAQAGEIERRATDLRAELDKMHEEMEQVRSSLTQALARAERAEAQATAHSDQRNATAQELIKQAEQRDQALQAAAAAREHAAELSGKLAAIQEQNAALLARLVPENNSKNK